MFTDLEILYDFVSNKLNPLKSTSPNVEVLESWHSFIREQCHVVRMNIASQTLKLPDDDHMRFYIQSYQRGLTYLANHLHSYCHCDKLVFNSDQPITLHRLWKIVYDILEDLIDFIITSFENYSLLEERPPTRKTLIAVHQFTEDIDKLQALSNEPNVYLNDVINTLSDLVQYPEKITYQKIDFLSGLTQAILNFPNQDFEKDLTLFIKYHFLHLNFNPEHTKFLFTTEYSAVIQSLKTDVDKLEKISFYLKRITQTQIQLNMAYEPKERSLKDHLTHWLIEELSFLEKNYIIDKLHEDPLDPNAKIMFNMSVPQLGGFLKFLVDVDIIKTNNLTELAKLVARGSRTKGTANISSESLRIKMYDIEESTKDDISGLVINMMNAIKNHRNYIILLHAALFNMEEWIPSLAVFLQ